MTEYTRLTSKLTPVWSSARKISVAAELRAAFSKPTNVVVDQPKQPDAPVPIPTKSPDHNPNILLILALLGAVGAGAAWVWRKLKGKNNG